MSVHQYIFFPHRTLCPLSRGHELKAQSLNVKTFLFLYFFRFRNDRFSCFCTVQNLAAPYRHELECAGKDLIVVVDVTIPSVSTLHRKNEMRRRDHGDRSMPQSTL
ncbi:hypothetical protein SETIT_1G131300v2 [Setaria italica]|uniref:Uncharacterized protein n=2 Tax=Setaria TaxID=4554 RepID=A0A368PKU3_SETIT|nr:hypothetical protein SETIT_1G131300v2 [Setaria italica]TKW38661.1 hypothetical protein SEVIR_1G130100v2 [Setaria viridis]